MHWLLFSMKLQSTATEAFKIKKMMQKHNNIFIKMVNMTNTGLNNYCMNKEICIIMQRYFVTIFNI